MKITVALLVLLVLFLPNTYPQDYTQMNLPEGAVARLSKGAIETFLYSPDGARFAVLSSVGIWLYDTATYREVALLVRDADRIQWIGFSPDSATVASAGSWQESTVRLWDTETGEPKATLTGHTGSVYRIAFSPDGATLAGVVAGKAVGLWDAVTGEHKGTLTGHTGSVKSVRVQPGWEGAC